jgi:hypothetical protein
MNRSPQRGQFTIDNIIKRVEQGDKSAENAESEIEYIKSFHDSRREQEAQPEWRENNMEYDLRSTPWICDKVKASEVYAQNLYAAMCNNDFQRNDMMPILKGQTWGCSWRYAGGIVADMCEQGDYIDYYCSGIRDSTPLDDEAYNALTKEQQEYYLQSKLFVSESVVTDEIRSDLKKLGWLVLDEDNKEI